MTKHIVQLPNPDGSLLLRELNHRIKNELTSAIYAVSAKAVQSDSRAVKAALLDVVDLLHQCADVHRALRMPDQGRLTDAARYLQQLCFSITKYADQQQRNCNGQTGFGHARITCRLVSTPRAIQPHQLERSAPVKACPFFGVVP